MPITLYTEHEVLEKLQHDCDFIPDDIHVMIEDASDWYADNHQYITSAAYASLVNHINDKKNDKMFALRWNSLTLDYMHNLYVVEALNKARDLLAEWLEHNDHSNPFLDKKKLI